jgi:hypothetical protein
MIICDMENFLDTTVLIFKYYIKMGKRMLQIVLTLLLILCLIPVTAAAIAPPKVIAERNLEAVLIAIGEVVSIKANDVLPHFAVKVEHVIKGYDLVKKDDQISVLFRPGPSKDEEITYHVQGYVPVKVKVGCLVIVYLERSREHPDFFKPLLEGLSVVTVGSPLPVENR